MLYLVDTVSKRLLVIHENEILLTLFIAKIKEQYLSGYKQLTIITECGNEYIAHSGHSQYSLTAANEFIKQVLPNVKYQEVYRYRLSTITVVY